MPQGPRTTRERVDQYISQAREPQLECRLGRHHWPGLLSGGDFVSVIPTTDGRKKVVEDCMRGCEVARVYPVNPETGVVTEKPKLIYPEGYLWKPEAGGDGFRMGTIELNLIRVHLLAERERRLKNPPKKTARAGQRGNTSRPVPAPQLRARLRAGHL